MQTRVSNNERQYVEQTAPVARNTVETSATGFPAGIQTIKIPRPSLDIQQSLASTLAMEATQDGFLEKEVSRIGDMSTIKMQADDISSSRLLLVGQVAGTRVRRR